MDFKILFNKVFSKDDMLIHNTNSVSQILDHTTKILKTFFLFSVSYRLVNFSTKMLSFFLLQYSLVVKISILHLV